MHRVRDGAWFWLVVAGCVTVVAVDGAIGREDRPATRVLGEQVERSTTMPESPPQIETPTTRGGTDEATTSTTSTTVATEPVDVPTTVAGSISTLPPIPTTATTRPATTTTRPPATTTTTRPTTTTTAAPTTTTTTAPTTTTTGSPPTSEP